MAEANPTFPPAAAPSSVPANANRTPPSPLAKFPPEVCAAHERFMATGDLDALSVVVLAVFRDFQPARMRAIAGIEFPDSARLIEDLGFDSLGLAEIVFFIEDLYKISISNEEITAVVTVGQLKAFVLAKVGSLARAK